LPAHRRVNQQLKRDRLPSAAALQHARDAMLRWWGDAYLSAGNTALQRRFVDEARASLPAMAPDVDEVFAAVGLQWLRLHQDQQVLEWDGGARLIDTPALQPRHKQTSTG
jgi:hypothetical protein